MNGIKKIIYLNKKKKHETINDNEIFFLQNKTLLICHNLFHIIFTHVKSFFLKQKSVILNTIFK